MEPRMREPRMTVIEAYGIDVNPAVNFGVVYDIWTYLDDNEISWPFLTEDNCQTLDRYYNFNHSGDKPISGMIRRVYSIMEESAWRELVAKTFVDTYADQLIRQWENFSREYNPIDNYHVTETTNYVHTAGSATSDSGKDTKKKTGTTTTTGGLSYTEKGTSYDSTTLRNIRSVEYDNGDEVTTSYGAGLQDEISYGKIRYTNDNASDVLVNEKQGNLGIQSLSDLLQKDIELWMMNFYTTIFFPLIDKLIALPIY